MVVKERWEESSASSHYFVMLAMSAGIAILGLLLSSPAVVIGAMLISPLIGPTIGLGFALATADYEWMKLATRSLVAGTVLAVLLCALIVSFSPLQTVTSEIAARTRPNLFDLLVALFSAVAGAYAMIRGRHGAIVGVAIATALMPPLAIIGFGLATLNWTVFSGALLLYFTNLMTIALTSAIMARLYGFSTSLSPKHTVLQNVLIATALLTLAVPLTLSLWHVAQEANDTRLINSAVRDIFDGRARVSQIDINFHVHPTEVSATVLTPKLRPDAEQATGRSLQRSLGRPVRVKITQFRVGTGAQAAEEAQLRSAQAKDQSDIAHADELAERLALIAGASEEDVLTDRERRIATVVADNLPGADLATYRELEARLAASEPGWTIRLRPPPRALPQVAFSGGKPTAAGAQAIELIAWAGQRVPAPVLLSGPDGELDQVAQALAQQGVAVRKQPGGRGPVTAKWGAPDA
jgi:uncharacterized hydrophobic protein (TIGR00271 family)